MTNPTVTITHSLVNGGTPTVLYCSSVRAGNKRSLNATPNANVSGPVEVQGKSVENRRLVIQGVMYDTTKTTITPDELEDLLQLDYDGTNAPIINVTYGKTGDQTLKSMGGSANIPVIVESYDYPIDVRDTKGGYMPVGSITVIETVPNS